jgi:hypothetical protein
MAMPFEYLDVKIEFAFNKTEKLPLNFRYLGICKDRVEKKTFSKFNRYDDVVYTESYFFKEYQRVNYQLNTENNQIASYGKLITENDTYKRVGDWYFSNPRNMITYSREFEFQVTAGNDKVDSTLKIFAVKKGIQTKLKYRYQFDWFHLWLSPDIDSIIFQWNNYTNTISKFNNNYYQSKFIIELIKNDSKMVFPKKYTQFIINESIEFDKNVFLLNLMSKNDGKLELQRSEFIWKYNKMKFQVDSRYSEEYLLVDFEGYSKDEINSWLSKWIGKNEIESAHQRLNNGKDRIAFFGNSLTIKPIQSIYNDSLNKIVKKGGFKVNHNFGDGSYQVKSQTGICDQSLFEAMLKIIRDKRFIIANPEFFNPIKMTFDEGDREGMLDQPKKRIPKR